MSERKQRLGKVFTTFLLMLVGIALTSTIQEEVTKVTGVGGFNLTGADKYMMKIII